MNSLDEVWRFQTRHFILGRGGVMKRFWIWWYRRRGPRAVTRCSHWVTVVDVELGLIVNVRRELVYD